ncbi:MAG: glycosyltransferase family 4 protein [Plesiomonas shigelloides]
MRIAIVGTVASSILVFRRDLISDFVSRGHTVYAFAIDYTPETKLDVSALGAIPVDYSISRGGINPFVDILNTYRLIKLFKLYRPDMVLTYFAKPVIFGTVAAKFAGVKKCIGMLEGLGYTFTNQQHGVTLSSVIIKKIQVFLYKLTLPYLDELIFLNHDDPKDLLVSHKIAVKSYTVLGGIGLDLDEYGFAFHDTSQISFLFIGRLLAEKGINEFVAAAKIVKKQYPFIEFVVLGSLDENNPGSIAHKDLNLLTQDGIIIYPGQVCDVRDWIKRSSVFVLPSYREGFPRSTQEAMAMGRAVITTDVPGCRESVIDGVNGFIIPAWSSDKLAEKMIYFINNQEKIVEMGVNARTFAETHYDVKKANQRIFSILGLDSGVVN